MAIQEGVTDCWREPLEDDGTVVVMAIEEQLRRSSYHDGDHAR